MNRHKVTRHKHPKVNTEDLFKLLAKRPADSRGVYATVAVKVERSLSHVCRVGKGERVSPKILDAIIEEMVNRGLIDSNNEAA